MTQKELSLLEGQIWAMPISKWFNYRRRTVNLTDEQKIPVAKQVIAEPAFNTNIESKSHHLWAALAGIDKEYRAWSAHLTQCAACTSHNLCSMGASLFEEFKKSQGR